MLILIKKLRTKNHNIQKLKIFLCSESWQKYPAYFDFEKMDKFAFVGYFFQKNAHNSLKKVIYKKLALILAFCLVHRMFIL